MHSNSSPQPSAPKSDSRGVRGYGTLSNSDPDPPPAANARQLRIDDAVAAALHACLAPAAGAAVTSLRAVARGFVLPWRGGGAVGARWVRAEPLSSGLEGLGLASGRSARLRLGDAEYVGAAAARCGGAGGGTLEGRLAALAGRQRWVNEERRRAAGAAGQSLAEEQPKTVVLQWDQVRRRCNARTTLPSSAPGRYF